MRGIHRWPVNSPHKWPVTLKNVSIWWRHHKYRGYWWLGCALVGGHCPPQVNISISCSRPPWSNDIKYKRLRAFLDNNIHRKGFNTNEHNKSWFGRRVLTHWERVTHIFVGNLTIIGLDTGLSPCHRQAIIWTSDWILCIGPSGINVSEILIESHLKISSTKWRPFCLGLNLYQCHITCHMILSVHGITKTMLLPHNSYQNVAFD